MQIGQTIWAIDPCEFKGNNLLTENKNYNVIDCNESSFIIVNDLGYESLFFNIVFDTFFSLTPPEGKGGKLPTDEQIANMLADYHKECESVETFREKANVQLKHARLIRKALTQLRDHLTEVLNKE